MTAIICLAVSAKAAAARRLFHSHNASTTGAANCCAITLTSGSEVWDPDFKLAQISHRRSSATLSIRDKYFARKFRGVDRICAGPFRIRNAAWRRAVERRPSRCGSRRLRFHLQTLRLENAPVGNRARLPNWSIIRNPRSWAARSLRALWMKH